MRAHKGDCRLPIAESELLRVVVREGRRSEVVTEKKKERMI